LIERRRRQASDQRQQLLVISVVALQMLGVAATVDRLRDRTSDSLRCNRAEGKRALLFLDELQRVVDYADGENVLCDLVDIYGASTDAVVLVDGSNERAERTRRTR
jgi:hypothetical protein